MGKIIIAGNWKMHKTQGEALEFLQKFKSNLKEVNGTREVVLCAPFTALGVMSKNLCGGLIHLAAQNIHWEDKGAYTGEISGTMLTELGVDYVVVGHSERRQYFGETNETVNLRGIAAQRYGLTPILCVGESKSQRDAGETEIVIINQVKQSLVNLDQSHLVIAYEPVWAIGTGETCEATEANRVISIIRSQLSNKEVTIQYGGSVKPSNVDEIMAQPEIDGVLVGGASLDPVGFARIVNYQ
ncbi:triosephosphate isomerase [cyanobacterium endosymbiont of Rhopalodia gibberula]|uniref:triose-phosphate isomerase n=1 Tax=cyanobacterium endosymbiont of Rhopalodia gibberula TaxID=1763363 RepID=UPI000DC73381|nr:triose-phosphate isomerase [cyanobacterium endosymbiont of Rhopalodia gibberula]BBA79910.1 triosephosphate isomerase [cyanobacterium endosymbiont of Rhopalodia gibberula]